MGSQRTGPLRWHIQNFYKFRSGKKKMFQVCPVNAHVILNRCCLYQ